MSDTKASDKPRVYVSVLFCDTVIRDKNDMLSAIRVTEGYTINPVKIAPSRPDGTPDEERAYIVALPAKFIAIIKFCSEAPVDFTWTIKGTRPSGSPLSTDTTTPSTARIGPGAQGLTVAANLTISSFEPGDYWFEFCVDDVVVTKAPVRIVFGEITGPLEPLPPSQQWAPNKPLKSA